MGAQLVKQAYAFSAAHSLKQPETLMLVWMALHALDGDAKPRYFMAREESALALGRRVPDEPDPEQPDADAITRERAAAFQRVKTATAGLVGAGAVRHLSRGRTGQRAVYELTLNQLPSGARAQGHEP